MRARIDGEICELDDPPKLAPRQKHSIEVVIDRFKVRPDIAQRLNESLETALRLADGIVIIASLDQAFAEIKFSAKFACVECGYSLTELEPRLFSFNNPVGACHTCDGLGVEEFFDPERIIHDPHASLANGAIRGYDRRTPYYFALIEALAAHYDFSIDTPFDQLTTEAQQKILYGSGKTAIAIAYHRASGGVTSKKQPFEGVIPNMQRRYRQSESMSMREELSKYLSNRPCPACQGDRLCLAARHVFVGDNNLPSIVAMTIEQCHAFFNTLHLTGARGEIALKINQEIVTRLRFLMDVGLDYLSLSRSADTLSGGEAQRIRLASQIGSGLVGVMYILDEPSIGLHQRDNDRLLKTLFHLRDLGNTVIVVEHDEDAILSADYVLDIGPGAGIHGGAVVACGTPQDIMACPDSITGQYLAKKQTIAVPCERIQMDPSRVIALQGVSCNNLNRVHAEIPIGLLTCITGVSGSGKSTLINDTLYAHAVSRLNRAKLSSKSQIQAIHGLEHCDKVIAIDQSPISRTPRSNPATYTGLFTPIRELFANTPEARVRGYQPGRFSFNVRGGRCEACEGDGVIKVAMHFLPDMYVMCDSCQGKRYNRETLDIHFKGKTIHQVLDMTIEDACQFFSAIPALARRCQTLLEVGLGYVKLGQSATTLSGGEAQRIKLAKELSKRDTGRTLYILDEPTTGLHFHDIKQLLAVLITLRNKGNTLVVIEHNLDVIKTADWIIDLGPEGGSKGGQIIATGTPETVAACVHSYTGQYLQPVLAG